MLKFMCIIEFTSDITVFFGLNAYCYGYNYSYKSSY